jgi:GNAT superfamily N-acetyltransferase
LIEPVELGSDSAAEIAAFTRQACEYDPLSATSVQRSIFEDTRPQVVLCIAGEAMDAVGVGVVQGETGHVKLLAVHPRSRRRGIGAALLERIERFCADHGAKTMSVGHLAPWFVVPGVDVRYSEMILLMHARGYRRYAESVNQSVALRNLPEPPLPVRVASHTDHEAIKAWLAQEHPNWLNEVERGFRLGNLIVHEDRGFAAYDVNREGWFGPMATRGGPGGERVGTSTLLGALHAMGRLGHEHADIVWVGPIVFYAKAVGARINRVFWSYTKSL